MPDAELGSPHTEISSRKEPCLCAHSHRTPKPLHFIVYRALPPQVTLGPPSASLKQAGVNISKRLILQMGRLRLREVK